MDSNPVIDADSPDGAPVNQTQGRLELKDIHFRYRRSHPELKSVFRSGLRLALLPATRPDAKVLNGVDITVEPGTYVAIVGASGSGYVSASNKRYAISS